MSGTVGAVSSIFDEDGVATRPSTVNLNGLGFDAVLLRDGSRLYTSDGGYGRILNNPAARPETDVQSLRLLAVTSNSST